jgi:hypothetical protein
VAVSGDRPRKRAKSLMTLIWADCAYSPMPRMCMTSIIRWRSGVVLSSVMKASCPMKGEDPDRQTEVPIEKCTFIRSMPSASQERPCLASGFVLGPGTSMRWPTSQGAGSHLTAVRHFILSNWQKLPFTMLAVTGSRGQSPESAGSSSQRMGAA